MGLALQATHAIQEWCQTVMDGVTRQIDLTGEFSARRLNPIGAWIPLALPVWVGVAVAPKSTQWGNDEQPPEKGGYFLISFQEKAGAPWHVELRWGLFEGVKRTKGKFKVLDICREILDSVNRYGAGLIEAEHATGSVTMTNRDLIAVMDRTAIQRLTEDVIQDFERLRS
jgi:hypothetical protein